MSFVGGKPVFAKYMDSFPFPYYIVLRDTGGWAQPGAEGRAGWVERSRRPACCSRHSSTCAWCQLCHRCHAHIDPLPQPHAAAALPRTLADLLRQWFELSRMRG